MGVTGNVDDFIGVLLGALVGDLVCPWKGDWVGTSQTPTGAVRGGMVRALVGVDTWCFGGRWCQWAPLRTIPALPAMLHVEASGGHHATLHTD
jgi:hypothetical protein